MIFDLNFSMFEISVRSFCTLTIFAEGLGEMMSACKARALDEGGMMKTSWAQSWYYDEFFTSLLRPIWNSRRAWKFNARVIRNHPRAGNHVRESKFLVKPCQNHPKLRKWENQEKQPKTWGFINFAPSNMHFRSADAANHLNARPREIVLTRRAY